MTSYSKDIKHKQQQNAVIKTQIYWDRLTKDEKEDIINNAKKRKEEKQRLDNIKNADIIAGKQKIIDNAWEQKNMRNKYEKSY